uniref:UPF0215 protein ENM78_02385 n=1 Tax=Fervidicoccus fontis TaxID=683846 RepID=A0A7J3ZJM9_9CREN
MKRTSISIGIDDGFFPPPPKKKGLTVLAGVLTLNLQPLRAALERVTIDGLDGTERAVEIVKRLLEGESGDVAVFLDGISIAGFNYIDPQALEESTGTMVVAVFRGPLSLEKIERALKKHFSDWEHRLSIYRLVVPRIKRATTKRGRVYYYAPSLDSIRAIRILEENQIYSPIPEPLRIADMLASEVSRLLRRMRAL